MEMSNVELWKVFASLGVPGVALGVFFMLFRKFQFESLRIPRKQVFPTVVLFMLLTSSLIFYALTLWAPKDREVKSNQETSKSSTAVVVPTQPPKQQASKPVAEVKTTTTKLKQQTSNPAPDKRQTTIVTKPKKQTKKPVTEVKQTTTVTKPKKRKAPVKTTAKKKTPTKQKPIIQQQTKGNQSPAIITEGNVTITYGEDE